MGRVFQNFLDGDKIYICNTCHTHIATHDDILSKAFHGRHGKAYLFKRAENVTAGTKENRLLLTGLHTVADVSCDVCHTIVGWKYEYAFEASQKYKEGKYIIEKVKIAKENLWD
jgi:hypothetical protein